MPSFNTLVVDPPWTITMAGRRRREGRGKPLPVALPYETMSLTEIKTLPIRQIAASGAHVYLWATNKTLRDAFDVLEAWEVAYHLTLVMTKRSGLVPAQGYVFGTEFCLLGFAGRPAQRFNDMGALNWLRAPSMRRHSAKPPAFYDLVQRMSPGPRADLFAREKRLGWQAWGKEVGADFEMPEAAIA